jgi:poly-gamma-glutamate capsule biosynthesis protein CapA/YwtB (metallophosphatase superfamily)
VTHWKTWLALGLLYFIPFFVMLRDSEQVRQKSPADLSVYPWIYLRDNRPLEKDELTVEGIFVGDILCGREGKNLALDLSKSASWLRSADFTMGNLECVITSRKNDYMLDQQMEATAPILLYAVPRQLMKLREAGFDILGVANNHAYDLGLEGFAETLRYLRQTGIKASGVCGNTGCADSFVIKSIGELRIAIFSINAIPHIGIANSVEKDDILTAQGWDSYPSLLSAIQFTRQYVDAVVVSVHWGREYETQISPSQKEIAHQLISAGADLVVGHHPHVPQRVEIFTPPNDPSEGVVAYSLGNFATDQLFGETVESYVLRAYFDKQGVRAVQVLLTQAGPQPHLLEIDQAALLYEKIMPEGQQLTFGCDREGCYEKKSSSVSTFPGSGLFWSGEIDLTGDGEPEKIMRQAGSVIVFQDGIEVWRTPQNWQVVDLALGDPDGDGRQEMLIAFWKVDALGMVRSHPFIVGYRGGNYHETWGGSGVSDPILEVELADVDLDGNQELLILEQRANNLQSVTVWDWHGWGFSLKWRSSEGAYKDLSVKRDQLQGQPLFWVIKLASPWNISD